MLQIRRASSISSDWLKMRRNPSPDLDPALEGYVREIMDGVRNKGDKALVEFTKRFDGVDLAPDELRVSAEGFEEAYKRVSREQLDAIRHVERRIRRHENRRLDALSFRLKEEGIEIHNTTRPITSVGCYVPGGRASYPSTLLMTAVPARVAGVPRVIVCSPPSSSGEIHPLILVAADVCGVDEVYRVGGAQAIAAMAYGTESIRPVMKVVGPGNRFVTMAKLLASRVVGIDLPAGPSEVVVLADSMADPRLVALDMVSQAEHGTDSVVGLVTTSEALAEEVIAHLSNLTSTILRREAVASSLSENAFIIVCDDIDEAISLINAFAPEHLEIVTVDPSEVSERISSAGLMLLGPYSPVSASDYCVGTNHVLPTGGFAHIYSGLSAIDFVKRISIVRCTRGGLRGMMNTLEVLAEGEDLPNHLRAARGRFREDI